MNNMLHQQILIALQKHQDKGAAEADRKYHKYGGYHSFGIKAPLLAKLLKEFRAQVKALSRMEVLALAEMLYKEKIEEAVLAGNFVLQNNIYCLGKTELSFFDKGLNYFGSWSTTDDFCIDVLQPVLLKHPKDTINLLKQWNRSKNIWKRRASVVAFVRKVGETGKFTNEALKLCNNLIWDEEDLVRKGVGWCLKDIMRGDKKSVIQYVKGLKSQGVSSVIILYAIRDLKGTERDRILQISKGSGQ